MLRSCFLAGIFLFLPQYAYSQWLQGTPEFGFDRQHLFFADTNVTLRCHCPDKTQVSWSIESADRKLLAGVAPVRDRVARVEFKTPPLKDGVTLLELKLVVDDKSQPLFLVSRDVFAEQRDWLEDLNIILLDDEDGDAGDVLKAAEIPFTTVEGFPVGTTGALILITREKFSMSDYNLARQGNFVVVIAPEELDMVVPQMSNFGAQHSFQLTSYETRIFTDSLEDDLPFRIFDEYPLGMFFLLRAKENRVTLQTITDNTSGTGWNYAEFRFAQKSKRLLFVNADLFENWNRQPDSQVFLKMLFDEVKSARQSTLNKEK